MRFVDRTEVEPPQFIMGSGIVRRMREDLALLFGSSKERRSQTFASRGVKEVGEGIRRDLENLFNGCCAFCESEGGQPYLFRPSSEAEPIEDRSTSHLYYTWLQTSWDNWFLICDGCRPKNPAFFPVNGERVELPEPEALRRYAGMGKHLYGSWSEVEQDIYGKLRKERNLLLDPTSDRDLYKHLHVTHEGLLEPLTKRGTATVDHFDLNRAELVDARQVAVSNLDTGLRARKPFEEIISLRPGFTGIMRLRLRFLVNFLAMRMNASVSRHEVKLGSSIRRMVDAPRGEEFLEFAFTAPASALNDGIYTLVRRPHRWSPKPTFRPTAIEIKNFKSIENLKIKVPDQPAPSVASTSRAKTGSVLLLGENASGKSTILEATVLALVDKEVRAALDQTPKHLVLDPKFIDATTSQGRRERAEVNVTLNGEQDRVLSITPKRFDEPDDPAPLPVFAYGAFRQFVSGGAVSWEADRYVSTLFRSNTLLPNPTQWLCGLDDGMFAMVARSLREIFAVEEDIDVLERDISAQKCFVLVPYKIGDHETSERTPLEFVSSGFRSVLAMACDIMRGLIDQPGFQSLENARAIVLIDEIEAHLHPRWKIAIMSAFRSALPEVTFIATSHDPLCLRGMGTGEVLVLNRVRGVTGEKDSLPVFIETLEELPNIEHLTIEQLLTADFFQLNSTDSFAAESRYAKIADMLSREAEGGELRGDEAGVLSAFRQEIGDALPVGNSEVQRLVQEAVAHYLSKRSAASRERLRNLREDVKKDIIKALRSI